MSIRALKLVACAALATVAGSFAVRAGDERSEDRGERRVVARGLQRPTGIAAGSDGLYVTQLPTPGVPGPRGGANKVSFVNRRGRVVDLAVGEPEPTNLAVSLCGDVYWTCRTAGVILTLGDDGQPTLFLGGLEKPTGIAVDPFDDEVYWTELPTPGVPGPQGGRNRVAVLGTEPGAVQETLDLGDPEPTDIAVGHDGTVYWTCKTAGVIVMFRGGVESVVVRGLASPTGLAIDRHGNLYFTELPTPGVPGSQGGKNKVSALTMRTGAIETISAGDPEPRDVAVARNGEVFWTDATLGTIFGATRGRRGW